MDTENEGLSAHNKIVILYIIEIEIIDRNLSKLQYYQQFSLTNQEEPKMLTVEKIFDMSAKSYDKTEEVQFKQYTNITIENTKKHLKPNDVVLDFGCATGAKALSLAGNVQKIEAIDISSKMIEAANKKAAGQEIKNIIFSKASIFDEKFKMKSFDVILLFNILHLLNDNQEVMRRITELLKPGGLFISTTPCLGEKMQFPLKLKFLPVVLMMKAGLFPTIKRFKFNELEELIAAEYFKIIEAEKYVLDMSNYFIVAKKMI